MIAPDLAGHIIKVIDWHATWLRAKDFGNYGEVAVTDAFNRVVMKPCRVLRFEVTIRRSGFRKRQCISLPERSIEDAIKVLSVQPGFKNRVARRSLSYLEVNEIIRLASNDTIPLELEPTG